MYKIDALNHIKRFAVFYGRHGERCLDRYDLLILEPAGHTSEQIGIYKKAGKTVVAYQSVLETGRHQDCFERFDPQTDYVMLDGKPIYNAEYDTVYLDVSKQKVIDMLYEQISGHFENGYDGVFLDTLGNLDYLYLGDADSEKLRSGVSALLGRVKRSYPDKIIIQNNGFLRLIDNTCDSIDAICFENPPLGSVRSVLWTMRVLKKLHCLMTEDKLLVLVLQEKRPKAPLFEQLLLKLLLKKYRFLYSRSPRFYR